jgi:hypothetical protein
VRPLGMDEATAHTHAQVLDDARELLLARLSELGSA